MIVKSSADVLRTRGDKRGDRWHSLRLLHTDDGMGVTLTDTILDPGFDMVLWQKDHFEACYCLEGDGTVEELDKGKVHEIRPGTLYAMDHHDPHRLRARTRMRIVCTFVPALTGREVHDADGSLKVDRSPIGDRNQQGRRARSIG